MNFSHAVSPIHFFHIFGCKSQLYLIFFQKNKRKKIKKHFKFIIFFISLRIFNNMGKDVMMKVVNTSYSNCTLYVHSKHSGSTLYHKPYDQQGKWMQNS